MRNDGKFSNFLRTGLLGLMLLVTVPAFAQNNDNTTRPADNRDDDRRVATRERDEDPDWGWLGLLGLAGLLGLMPRKKHEVHVRDTARDVRNTDAGGRR